MELDVCHKGTVRVPVRIIVLALVTVVGVLAQSLPDWRRIGTSGIDLMLASAATGPVEQVWYSADGAVLYARTFTGKIFQTEDFEAWQPALNPPEPAPLLRVPAVRLPEP